MWHSRRFFSGKMQKWTDAALGLCSKGSVFPGSETEAVLDEFEGETANETDLGSQGWNLQMCQTSWWQIVLWLRMMKFFCCSFHLFLGAILRRSATVPSLVEPGASKNHGRKPVLTSDQNQINQKATWCSPASAPLLTMSSCPHCLAANVDAGAKDQATNDGATVLVIFGQTGQLNLRLLTQVPIVREPGRMEQLNCGFGVFIFFPLQLSEFMWVPPGTLVNI